MESDTTKTLNIFGFHVSQNFNYLVVILFMGSVERLQGHLRVLSNTIVGQEEVFDSQSKRKSVNKLSIKAQLN